MAVISNKLVTTPIAAESPDGSIISAGYPTRTGLPAADVMPLDTMVMDVNGYRRILQKALFTCDGHVPNNPLQLSPIEQDATLTRIDRTWNMLGKLAQYTAGGREESPLETTGAETWMALKRWFLSHHLFIAHFSVLSHCLSKAAEGLQEPKVDVALARRWVLLASRLRKGCGGLFIYGTEFVPCSAIYCHTIRNGMPPAFSGFWIRERHNCLQPTLVRFLKALSTSERTSSTCTELRNTWIAADQRYHELHVECMQSAVQGGKSLASAYRDETGRAHQITAEEFRQLDEWFCVERRPDMTRLDYIFQTCDFVERFAGDLLVGHRLPTPILAEIVDSLRALLVVFGDWAGPVHEMSRFYPKSLRGE